MTPALCECVQRHPSNNNTNARSSTRQEAAESEHRIAETCSRELLCVPCTEDEDDDYPYKEWVASLARRTLQPPISSARDLASRTWLMEKEEVQNAQWQESFRKEKLFLPAVTMPAITAPQRQGMHLLGGSRRLKQQKVVARHGDQRWRFVGKARCAEAQAVSAAEGATETDEYVPSGWGNLKDYVHGASCCFWKDFAFCSTFPTLGL